MPISKEQLDDFGKILHENWMLKKKLASNITDVEIDKIYETALSHGATGGKVLGAGGGGFILLFADKSKHNKIKESLKPLSTLDFKFENDGSKLIYFGDE